MSETESKEFSFANQAANFAEHISKSIPGYTLLIDYIVEITRSFAVKGTDLFTGYDIGCSTGEMLKLLSEEYPDADFGGMDVEEAMVENAVHKGVELGDALVDDIPYANIYYSIFTLQFLQNNAERQEIINQVYEKLPPRGAFIVAEKVLSEDVLVHDIMRNAQVQYKRKHFTDAEILDKERDLRRIMRPVKRFQLLEELKHVGFSDVEPVWQMGQFVAYLCVKR